MANNQVMDNIELNIQLHTLYGSISMMSRSVEYRYNMVAALQEQCKIFNQVMSNLIDNNESQNDEGIDNLIDEVYEFETYLNKYENEYGESITNAKKQEDKISSLYHDMIRQNIDDKSFKEYIEELNKYDYTLIQGNDFIDYEQLIEAFSEEINKINDREFKSKLEALIQQMSYQFKVISQQNDVIASTIDLIQTINLEVK